MHRQEGTHTAECYTQTDGRDKAESRQQTINSVAAECDADAEWAVCTGEKLPCVRL